MKQAFLESTRGDLAAARDLLARVRSSPDRTVAGTLEPYNQLLIHLGGASARAELFVEVHPDAELRAAAEEVTREAAKLHAELMLDHEVYAALAAVPTEGLDAATRRFVEHTLRDFRRSGVDKDPETRARIKELRDQLVETGIVFDRNIREDVRRVRVAPEDLAGLPEDYIAAHKPGDDGQVEISTDYPDYMPFRSYARSGAAREKLYRAFQNRGYPQNEEILRKLLVLRRELATILGYEHWAAYVTEDKMIKSAQNADEFIERIAALAQDRAARDVATLLARKRKDEPAAAEVIDHERAYYEEMVKREDLGFDSQSVRPYFEFRQTRAGLLAVTSRLFGVEYREVGDALVWHPDVAVYDVLLAGEKLGRIYLDLHPRENKYKHAAQFGLQSGVAGTQLPEGVLVCNFPDPKASEGPALMDHDDVVTMFHEFGHLMHHILAGRQRWVTFSGVATEWDFVEAPSQMLEEWAWDTATLQLFARHIDTGAPIPDELVHRMREANEFGKGIYARTQMFYAALSLRTHTLDPATIDFTALTAELQSRYGAFKYIDGTHMFAAFGHLNGYSAIYYTYMWSLVIAKDLFSAFRQSGLLDPATTARYRDEVLVPGGSRDAADLVHSFLGRPYSFEAYRAWLEQG